MKRMKEKGTHWILSHGLQPITNAIEQIIEMTLVFVVVKLAASLPQLACSFLTLVFQDVSLLEKDL